MLFLLACVFSQSIPPIQIQHRTAWFSPSGTFGGIISLSSPSSITSSLQFTFTSPVSITKHWGNFQLLRNTEGWYQITPSTPSDKMEFGFNAEIQGNTITNTKTVQDTFIKETILVQGSDGMILPFSTIPADSLPSEPFGSFLFATTETQPIEPTQPSNKDNPNNTHNTFWITFGVIGGIVVLSVGLFAVSTFEKYRKRERILHFRQRTASVEVNQELMEVPLDAQEVCKEECPLSPTSSVFTFESERRVDRVVSLMSASTKKEEKRNSF